MRKDGRKTIAESLREDRERKLSNPEYVRLMNELGMEPKEWEALPELDDLQRLVAEDEADTEYYTKCAETLGNVPECLYRVVETDAGRKAFALVWRREEGDYEINYPLFREWLNQVATDGEIQVLCNWLCDNVLSVDKDRMRHLFKELPEDIQKLVRQLYSEVWSSDSIEEIVEEQALKKGYTDEQAREYSSKAYEIGNALYADQNVEALDRSAYILGYVSQTSEFIKE